MAAVRRRDIQQAKSGCAGCLGGAPPAFQAVAASRNGDAQAMANSAHTAPTMISAGPLPRAAASPGNPARTPAWIAQSGREALSTSATGVAKEVPAAASAAVTAIASPAPM